MNVPVIWLISGRSGQLPTGGDAETAGRDEEQYHVTGADTGGAGQV